ncbi:hypothetical protein MMC22_008026 [Lobaria immixta]|nr:hypothetical protein [Lobaria immixta]
MATKKMHGLTRTGQGFEYESSTTSRHSTRSALKVQLLAFIPGKTDQKSRLQLKSVIPYLSGYRRRILLELSELDGSPDTRSLDLLDAASFSIANFHATEAVSDVAKGRIDADNVSILAENSAAVSIPLLGSQLATLAH